MNKTKLIVSEDSPKKQAKAGVKRRRGASRKKTEKGPARNRVVVHAYDADLFKIKLYSAEVVAKQILGGRSTQQDAFAVSSGYCVTATENGHCWAVVCDGMGGMTGGELASQMTVEVMQQVLQSVLPEDDINQVYKQAIEIANAEVNKLSESLDGTAGTTLVSVFLNNGRLYYASVGDSRIYISRDKEIVQITRDHNYYLELSERVAAGEITAEEAENDPQKEALISFVGIDRLNLIDVSTNPMALQNGDIILLCSDGLTKVLYDNEIQDIIVQCNREPEKIVDALLQEVQMGVSRSLDNTTIAVVKYQEQ